MTPTSAGYFFVIIKPFPHTYQGFGGMAGIASDCGLHGLQNCLFLPIG
ncbi:MAG: hypothetical protein ACO3NK_16030 [Prochlorotrichaceae cyanobacterium]